MDLVVKLRKVGETSSGELKTAEMSILSAGGFRLLGGPVLVAGDTYFVYDAGVTYATAAGAYSNGFNYNQVIAALFGRVGWKAETIDEAPGPNPANATSRSGRYFNDGGFHAIVSLANVKRLISDNAASDAEINAYLESLQKAAIMRSLNGVINEPELLEIGQDFERYREDHDAPINTAGLFVGRRIEPARLYDRAVQADTVALLFDSDVTFPLYLFQEGKKAHLWTGEVTAIANETTLVNLPDLVLTYLGANHLGGAYYLGYFQEDLGGARAIDQSRICPRLACNWALEFIESAKIPGETNFNRTVINGSPWSHGLNFQFSAFRDWTTTIVKRANLFDELIGLQMAVMIVEMALYAIRSNSTERILKDQLSVYGLFQQLDGVAPGVPDAPRITGLRQLVDREVARVKKSFYPNHRAITHPGNDCFEN
jgi:hypothetical protein